MKRGQSESIDKSIQLRDIHTSVEVSPLNLSKLNWSSAHASYPELAEDVLDVYNADIRTGSPKFSYNQKIDANNSAIITILKDIRETLRSYGEPMSEDENKPLTKALFLWVVIPISGLIFTLLGILHSNSRDNASELRGNIALYKNEIKEQLEEHIKKSDAQHEETKDSISNIKLSTVAINKDLGWLVSDAKKRDDNIEKILDKLDEIPTK